jgi:hypothetical protein
MELNLSTHSASSANTEDLIKIPSNLFQVDEKSHFSNTDVFVQELDNFLAASQQRDAFNSSNANNNHDITSYTNFADTLNQSQADIDLNVQLIEIFQKKIAQCHEKIRFLSKDNLQKNVIIQKLKANDGLEIANNNLKQKITLLEENISHTIQEMRRYF